MRALETESLFRKNEPIRMPIFTLTREPIAAKSMPQSITHRSVFSIMAAGFPRRTLLLTNLVLKMALLKMAPLAIGLLPTLLATSAAVADETTTADPVELQQQALDAKIQGLIDQLAADDFSRREKAQAELRSLGLAAFDALNAAQDSDDIEVAVRARYLLRSLPIHWAEETDVLEVKEILRGYDDKSEDERRNLMEQLSKLPARQGVPALCRLARFEPSDLLSKRAALWVMHQPRSAIADENRTLRSMILKVIGRSRRETAHWLRTYVDTLADPEATLAAWDEISQKERRIQQLTPERTSIEIVRDLLRWQADLLNTLRRNDEALAIMRRSIDLLDGTRESLLETVDWLMRREAWSIVEEVAQRFPQRFDEYAILMYRLAEAQHNKGETELATQTVQKALAINAGDLQEHIVTAFSLQERGLTDWAQAEYEAVINQSDPGSLHDLRSRFLLSEMLHDLQRELPAAKVLQVVVDLMDKDGDVVSMITRMGRTPGGVRSRMHYFYAEHFKMQGDTEKQMGHLAKGVEADPTDADVLIAMYRLEGASEQWQQTTKESISKAADSFRDDIRANQRQAAAAPTEEVRALYNRQLASANNQLAWLVGNTIGDYDEALRCSHRSLELRPETAGYLDTLGRCYYAKGDFENAVKYQSRAVELEPHTRQIARQLELFQKALQESQQKQ